MENFIQLYLDELKSEENKLFVENAVKGGFSEELKNKIKKLIDQFRDNQGNEGENATHK